MYNDATYDFVAVGVGPFNLGLACLSSALTDLRCVFLDKEEEFNWHPGMLIDGVTLQSPFLADLVSMADPTSPFSYLNYRKQQGSLFNFFVRENFYLERQEFNRYCRWAVSRLDNIRFNHHVEQVVYDLEQRVSLLAEADTSGHIRLTVELAGDDYVSQLRVILGFEAGQLEAIAKAVQRLFGE